MKSICFFSSYFTENKIPYYVKYYLKELQKHFTEVHLLMNEKVLTAEDEKYLGDSSIQYRLYKNEGFDFGMWYKAFNEFPVLDYEKIGLINDSCILFKSLDGFFDVVNNSHLDYCGMTDSNAVEYHVQSYFLIINKKAISFVADYFKRNGLKNRIEDVIMEYEIGLSVYLKESKLRIGACYSSRDYFGEYNPMLIFTKKFLEQGMPLIKKKIIYFSFRKEEFLNLMRMKYYPDPDYYIDVIKKVNQGQEIINFDNVTERYNNDLLYKKIKSFKMKSFFYQLFRKLKFKNII